MAMAEISFVMPVWNGEKYLREAVDSVLAQTFKDFELIIVDDGSTDATVSILESYQDERIRIVKQSRKGFVAAVNRGVAEARSEWIARHDADDISSPLRLEKQWNAIQRHPDASMAVCAISTFGDNHVVPQQAHFPRTKALVAFKAGFQMPFIVGSALIKRSAFLAAEGYREEEFPAEDFAFLSRMMKLGDFVGVPEVLYHVRKHEAQISVVKLQAQLEQTQRISRQNCRDFFQVPPERAERIFQILQRAPKDQPLGEWLGLVFCDLPRLKWQSVELWAWMFSQTTRRILCKIKRS